MAYVKQTWADGPAGNTPVNATRLQHIEDGILATSLVADAAETPAAVAAAIAAQHTTDNAAYLPITGASVTAQGLTLDDGTGQGVVSLTNTGKAQKLYGQSNVAGFAPGNSHAPIHLVAGDSGSVNDGTHDYNLALLVENYTANGAGVNVTNWGTGDGLYAQTLGAAVGTGFAINVFAGDSTHQTAVGSGINIQRYGTGSAIKINGQSGSGVAPLISIVQNVNGPVIAIAGDTATTADGIQHTKTGITSGNFINFYHASSAMTGNGIQMNFGNSAGPFTGKFISLNKAGALLWSVENDGRMTLNGPNSAAAPGGGGAAAPPATPTGYLAIIIAGVQKWLPYYG